MILLENYGAAVFFLFNNTDLDLDLNSSLAFHHFIANYNYLILFIYL